MLAPHATTPPPAFGSTFRAIARSARPPSQSAMVEWARTHVHASALAALARAFLQSSDAERVERLLRAGRHAEAAQRFCERFSQRHFPLDYAWAGDGEGRLLVEITRGIQHEGFGDNWEEYGDLWALRPVFALSWALMADPYGSLRDEYFEDEFPDKQDAGSYRLCDEAREVVAQFANLPVDALFGGMPGDGFPADELRVRFSGTRWEPLLWAAPWLWRLSGNAFLDQSPDDLGDSETWTLSTVFHLSAEYREALRIMSAIDAFDTWLSEARAERVRAAIAAAAGPSTNRVSNLLDLPIVARRAGSAAAAPETS
jgi:hypothetical protein